MMTHVMLISLVTTSVLASMAGAAPAAPIAATTIEGWACNATVNFALGSFLLAQAPTVGRAVIADAYPVDLAPLGRGDGSWTFTLLSANSVGLGACVLRVGLSDGSTCAVRVPAAAESGGSVLLNAHRGCEVVALQRAPIFPIYLPPDPAQPPAALHVRFFVGETQVDV